MALLAAEEYRDGMHNNKIGSTSLSPVLKTRTCFLSVRLKQDAMVKTVQLLPNGRNLKFEFKFR